MSDPDQKTLIDAMAEKASEAKAMKPKKPSAGKSSKAESAKGSEGKKPKKAKEPKLELSGRIAELAVANAAGRVTQVQFAIKTKKGKSETFALGLSHPNSLDAITVLLSSALSTRAKVHVKLSAGDDANRTVTEISVHAK